MRSWVDIATLAKTKNLQGGFVVESAANLPFLLEEGMEVVFVPPALDAPRKARVTSITQLAQRSAVVMFDAVCDIDTAEALAGCHCLVCRKHVPPEALLAARIDWAGWDVHDANTGLVGSVAGIAEMPGQDLLEVAAVGENRSILIPLVGAFIVGVNGEMRRLDLDVPAGLLDL